ncbi:M16 family metallopeptidase [Propionibacterium australiense]|uniref:Insulinase family protein n=1 Tax=Propionibacterium australiense TaxID=119981 RepID=A0A383S4V7_9ACTN|nr:pitrilysin family protein [Propionibacterium australiense]RLP11686.1 insulinase family protein [Propionibacterium australiense]RLP12199.1 insulinase family protein [Propionibacterium australiense]SYZ32424.1 Peptidase M16, C-terminal [Propionibacterium australiense]VEH90237.1 Peptidase M16 inactive domain [Propionibacterium australiense]
MSSENLRPPVDLASDWRFPLPEIIDLGNGMSIWAYDLPGQYVISTEIVFDLALSDEPAGKEGVAGLAARCCDEGSLAHPGEALARRIEDIGAVFDSSAGSWGTRCGIDVAAPYALAGIDLLDEIVRTPAYADSDVARHKALRLTEIEQQRANSAAMASIGLAQQSWVSGSRQQLPRAGTSTSVPTITPEDVRAFHDLWWRADGATLIIAGALPEGLVEHAAEVFGAWPATGVHSNAKAPAPAEGPCPTYVVDRPEAVAADMRVGLVVPGRDWADWAPMQVATSAVGGLFGSRLNMELRERQGFTYGVQAGLSASRFHGSFSIQASFRTEVTAQAFRGVFDLLDLSRRPLEKTEAEDAVRFMVGIAPLRYDTADAIAAQASVLASHRVDVDWVNELNRQLAATSANQATSAFEATVGKATHEGMMRAVLCGDAERLVPDLRSYGFQVAVIDPVL